MTTKTIEGTIQDSRDDLSSTSAGSLTGDIALVYDDTLPAGDLVNAAQRLVDTMREELT